MPDQSNPENLKKYTFCLFKKMGFQTEDGTFQEETLRQNFANVLPQNKIDEILTKCTVQKNTPEDSALSALTCIETINKPN
mgnify:CR=1 FL=1